MRNKALYGAYSFWFFISPERGLFVCYQSPPSSHIWLRNHIDLSQKESLIVKCLFWYCKKSRYVHTNVMIYRLGSQNFICLFALVLIAKLHNGTAHLTFRTNSSGPESTIRNFSKPWENSLNQEFSPKSILTPC